MIGAMNPMLLLLQASSCMAVGLLGSYLWARKPARGHQILLICMAAGVVLPGLYIGVQHLGLGQLRHDSPGPDHVAEPLEAMTLFEPAESVWFPVDLAPAAEIAPTMAPPVNPAETQPVPQDPFPWTLLGMGIWGAMSCLVLARLVLQFMLGLRLIQGSQRAENDSLTQALCTAQNRLCWNRPVTLCFSPKISSPVIWCWFKTPILLIQDIANPAQACCDWVGVFCHELAHAKRMDHIVNLWMDLLCVAMPWHPLVWWARQRLIRLSEDVCDDWVLVQGHASTRYAESLLTLTSQKQLAVMPSIIGKDSTMKERISRIIKGRISNPRPGTRWTCLCVTVTLCSIVGMALAQPEPEEPLQLVVEAPAEQDIQEPMALGTINDTVEPRTIDIAVIGRLNVLNRLLEQLTDQAAKTKQILDQAKSDSDRQMHQVELDTLGEQIALIEKQIQQTKHPEHNRLTKRTTATRRDLPPAEPTVARTGAKEPGSPEGLYRYYARGGAQSQQRVLRTRLKQIQEELKAVEPALRVRYEAGHMTSQDFHGRLRKLKNEMELIEAQLEEAAEPVEAQLMVYRLSHGRASQLVDIVARFVSSNETVADDQDTNSIIVHASPGTHAQIQQLLAELDTPRTDTRPGSALSSAGTSRSAGSTTTRRNRAAAAAAAATARRNAAATRTDTRPTSTLSRAGTSRSTSSTSPRRGAAASGSTNQTLNAEVDELRGQVKGLNDQMKEIRSMLELLIQQKQTETPATSENGDFF